MSQKKYDGVIEAVRFGADGQLEFARVYQRRGAAFSDLAMLSRQQLVSQLQKGKKYGIGSRKPTLGAQFDIVTDVQLAGGMLTTTGSGARDTLPEAPRL